MKIKFSTKNSVQSALDNLKHQHLVRIFSNKNISTRSEYLIKTVRQEEEKNTFFHDIFFRNGTKLNQMDFRQGINMNEM